MSVSRLKEGMDYESPLPHTLDRWDKGDPEVQAQELAYNSEVKEQDRWLPIANG
jgi:hypothetical protein